MTLRKQVVHYKYKVFFLLIIFSCGLYFSMEGRANAENSTNTLYEVYQNKYYSKDQLINYLNEQPVYHLSKSVPAIISSYLIYRITGALKPTVKNIPVVPFLAERVSTGSTIIATYVTGENVRKSIHLMIDNEEDMISEYLITSMFFAFANIANEAAGGSEMNSYRKEFISFSRSTVVTGDLRQALEIHIKKQGVKHYKLTATVIFIAPSVVAGVLNLAEPSADNDKELSADNDKELSADYDKGPSKLSQIVYAVRNELTKEIHLRVMVTGAYQVDDLLIGYCQDFQYSPNGCYHLATSAETLVHSISNYMTPHSTTTMWDKFAGNAKKVISHPLRAEFMDNMVEASGGRIRNIPPPEAHYIGSGHNSSSFEAIDFADADQEYSYLPRLEYGLAAVVYAATGVITYITSGRGLGTVDRLVLSGQKLMSGALIQYFGFTLATYFDMYSYLDNIYEDSVYELYKIGQDLWDNPVKDEL